MTEGQLIVSLGFTLVVALVCLAWYYARYSSYRSREGRALLAKRWLSPRGLATIFLLACAVAAASSVLELVEQVVLPSYYQEYSQYTGVVGGYPLWYLVLGVCLISPVCEELVFRGVVLHGARKVGAPVVLALVAQAALFGILHGSLFQVIYTFVVGLLLGLICLKTRSLVPVILIHVLNNVASLLLMGQSAAVDVIVIVVLVVGSLAALFLFGGGVLSLEPASTSDKDPSN